VNSEVFNWTAERIQRRVDLTDLETRGTLRLSLKEMGLEPRTVNKSQMLVMLTRVLPGALATRKVQGAKELCQRIALELETAELASPMLSTPEDVFRRIGR